MTIQIDKKHEQIVRDLIADGAYTCESAVIEEALELLRSRDDLRARIREGIEQLDRGEGIPADVVFERLKERLAGDTKAS